MADIAKTINDLERWIDWMDEDVPVVALDALAMLKEQQTIIDELLKVGYPHNFQREEPWIVNYMIKITDVVKKAINLRNGEKDGEQD